MPLSPRFPDYVTELLAGLGPVEIKRMFGGAALSKFGVNFGILDDDTFFIRADRVFAAELKKQGCKPWRYSVKKDGTVRDIGFWSLPDTAADDGDETVALACRSLEISRAAAVAKGEKKPKGRATPKAGAKKPEPAVSAAKAKVSPTKAKPKGKK